VNTTATTRQLCAAALIAALGTLAACAPTPPPGTNTTTTVAPEVVVNVTPSGATPSSLTVAPGQKVTVVGSGFTTTGNLGARPPLAGQPAGVYVTFGRFAPDWRPSNAAPSSARQVVEQSWALPTPSFNALGGIEGLVEMTASGGFTAELTAVEAPGTNANYGIAIYAGAGSVNATEEEFIPITFTAS